MYYNKLHNFSNFSNFSTKNIFRELQFVYKVTQVWEWEFENLEMQYKLEPFVALLIFL